MIMKKHLTLRLNKEVIDRAKEYAQKHKISLSWMIETYLDSLTQEKSKHIEITPFGGKFKWGY